MIPYELYRDEKNDCDSHALAQRQIHAILFPNQE